MYHTETNNYDLKLNLSDINLLETILNNYNIPGIDLKAIIGFLRNNINLFQFQIQCILQCLSDTLYIKTLAEENDITDIILLNDKIYNNCPFIEQKEIEIPKLDI